MVRRVLANSIHVMLAIVLLGAFAFAVPDLTGAPAAAQFVEPDMCPYDGSHSTLARGDSGEAVEHAQCLINYRLIRYGVSVAVDGVFGEQTEDAIEFAQAEFGLNADGVIGDCTWALLHAQVGPDPDSCTVPE